MAELSRRGGGTGKGRPTKLTPETQKRIVDAVTAGNYLDAACAYGGIDYNTLRRWMLRGDREAGAYRDFRDAILAAEAHAEVRIVAQWQAQIPTDWRAARDFLARRHPDRWAPHSKLSGPGGGPLESIVTIDFTRARQIDGDAIDEDEDPDDDDEPGAQLDSV